MRRFYIAGMILILLVACQNQLRKSDQEQQNAFYHYSKGIEELNKNRLDEALKCIDRAIDLNPNFAQFYNLKGDIYAAAKKIDAALDAYKTAIEKRTNFTGVYVKIAKIYENEFNDYPTALQYYRRAYASEVTRHDLLLNIANCYLEIDELSITEFKLFEYEKLIKENNNQFGFDYFYLKGRLRFLQKRFNDAISLLDQAVALRQSSIDANLLLAKALFETEEYERGLNHINYLLNEQRTNGELYFYRGLYFYNKHNYEDADIEFIRCLQFDPEMYEAHFYLGKIYEMENDNQKALKHFRLYRQQMKKAEQKLKIKG